MSHDPDPLALHIDLTRQLLADTVAERDRYADAPPWKPRTQQRRAAAARTVDELHTLLAELEARRRPVHAIILRTNGRHHPLHEPVTARELHLIVSDTLDVATGHHPDHPDVRIAMYVDDLGHQRGLPRNPTATALHGIGWPILGDVVITTDDDQPLPDDLVDQLVRRRPHGGHRQGPTAAPRNQLEDHPT